MHAMIPIPGTGTSLSALCRSGTVSSSDDALRTGTCRYDVQCTWYEIYDVLYDMIPPGTPTSAVLDPLDTLEA